MAFLRPLAAALRKPPLFTEVDESFWREPYVSEQILEAHLDPGSDDASRRASTIAQSTAWISRLVAPGARLLDLGCGPGLYCRGFARRGLAVCGLDYSTTAIEFARREAGRLLQHIDYRVADYRREELPTPFDVVTLIYGGFCCVTDEERDDLLSRIRRALVPGGLFVFDVFTREYIGRRWGGFYLSFKNGFWRPGFHLVVERRCDYSEADVHLDRYIVAAPKQGVEVYNMWKHHYTKETIAAVLARAGFESIGWYGDLSGAPFDPHGPWIGIVAKS